MLKTMLMLALASDPEAVVDDGAAESPYGGCTWIEKDLGCWEMIPIWAPNERICLCPWRLTTEQIDGAACEALGDGHYICPDAADLVVPAEVGEEVMIHVLSSAESSDSWVCDGEVCSFEYGLVTEDDALPAPPNAGGGCEPDDGSGVEPSKPRTVYIRTRPIDVHPTGR